MKKADVRVFAQGITLAPGYLFASDTCYRNYLLLDAAMLSSETDWAVERLGQLACQLAADGKA